MDCLNRLRLISHNFKKLLSCYGFFNSQFHNFTNPPHRFSFSNLKSCLFFLFNLFIYLFILGGGYFKLMSHGVNKKTPPSASPNSLPPARFSQGLFAVLQKLLYRLHGFQQKQLLVFIKIVFLKILQYSQENACARASF